MFIYVPNRKIQTNLFVVVVSASHGQRQQRRGYLGNVKKSPRILSKAHHHMDYGATLRLPFPLTALRLGHSLN
jgi:hypothetical protein